MVQSLAPESVDKVQTVGDARSAPRYTTFGMYVNDAPQTDALEKFDQQQQACWYSFLWTDVVQTQK